MKLHSTICAACLSATSLYAGTNATVAVEQIYHLAGDHLAFGTIYLKGSDRITTKASFKPPVEITIVAKTESNLRMAYAADQVIFNWAHNPTQLRMDGGPADGQHKYGAGQIPKNKFVTIKWIVRPDQQDIFVDGELRLQHRGNYSAIDRPVSVFCEKSKVAVTSIKVRDLSDQAAANTPGTHH